MKIRYVTYAAIVTAGVLPSTRARADEHSESVVAFGAAEVKFRGAQDSQATSLKAEGGLDFNGRALDGGFTSSAFVKSPARESAGSYRTRLDEFSSGWRGGLTLAHQWTDQSTRAYTADPCMVVLRRSATRADAQAELQAQRAALVALEREPKPSRPAPVPGALTPDERRVLGNRIAELSDALGQAVSDDDATRAADQAELGLLQARLEYELWVQSIAAEQKREHAARMTSFEASQAQRAQEIQSEIDGLARSVAADEAQIAEAQRELDGRGDPRDSNGNCVGLREGWKVRLFGSGEFGGQRYAWRPLDAADDIERARYSGAAQVTLDAEVTQRLGLEETGWVFGPALTARYTQEWSDANEIGVLDPSALDPTVSGEVALDSRVVGAPVTRPTLSFRVFSYFAPPTPRRMFAFGPALAFTTVGETQTDQGVHAPWGDKLVTRGEFWLYFMPTDADTVNTRLGIAPFFDASVLGRVAGEPVVDSGALFSFQVGRSVTRY